ncbi:hypothetical protein [Salinisphaera dokdonensis]|uniref:hypothetical protein n=1 Tax=Salinisphaera dokdonensis TaxID=454598 RepID=UPI003340BF6E
MAKTSSFSTGSAYSLKARLAKRFFVPARDRSSPLMALRPVWRLLVKTSALLQVTATKPRGYDQQA